MLDNQSLELEQFLDQIHIIEARVIHFIAKSDLSEQEKQYILDHILIVPSKSCMKVEI